MPGTVNIAKTFKPKGLSPNTLYEAKVVDNKDPRKLCRVKARVPVLFEGISDKDLPWAIPSCSHIQGAYRPEDNNSTERSGVFHIPTKDSKVMLTFMDGDPLLPIWSSYIIDDKTILKEELEGPKPDEDDRYPERAVIRMRNGTYLIIDSKSSEIFINSPGDLYLTVLGDVHETIVGNATTKVTSNINDIPEYIKTSAASKLHLMKQKRNKKFPFEGTLSPVDDPGEKGSNGGNHYTIVEGNELMWIKGNRKIVVEGNNNIEIRGTETINVRQNRYVKAQNIYHN